MAQHFQGGLPAPNLPRTALLFSAPCFARTRACAHEHMHSSVPISSVLGTPIPLLGSPKARSFQGSQGTFTPASTGFHTGLYLSHWSKRGSLVIMYPQAQKSGRQAFLCPFQQQAVSVALVPAAIRNLMSYLCTVLKTNLTVLSIESPDSAYRA